VSGYTATHSAVILRCRRNRNRLAGWPQGPVPSSAFFEARQVAGTSG